MLKLIISIAFFWAIAVYAVGQTAVARYTFDGGAANDISGNNNNGIKHGNLQPVRDRFNNPCGALYFDGASSYIEVPNSPSLGSITKSFAVTVWYKFYQPSDNMWLTILCKGITQSELPNNPQYRLQVQQSSASVSTKCNVNAASPVGFSTVSINTGFTVCDASFHNHPLPVNQWCFFAITYNGQKVTAYMNNNKVFEEPYTGLLVPNNTPLFIGFDEPGNHEYFKGAMDDLSLFNTALSEAEILKIYNKKMPVSAEGELAFMPNLVFALPQNKCSKIVNFTAPVVADACGNVQVKQVEGPLPGSAFNVGTTRVTFEVKEAPDYIQRSSFLVVLKDVTPPVFTSFPADTLLEVDDAATSIAYQYAEPTATDNCGLKTLQLIRGPASGSIFATGTTLVEYEALDKSNNKTVKQFTVTVKAKKPKQVIPLKDSVMKPVIKDTTPSTKKPVTDTVIKTSLNNTAKNKQTDSLGGRKNIVEKVIEVDTSQITISLYDDAIDDGDTVTVYYNNEIVLYKQKISRMPLKFTIKINENAVNELVMFADNLGEIPPNTGVLVFYAGPKRYEINFQSTLTTNGRIIFKQVKKGH